MDSPSDAARRLFALIDQRSWNEIGAFLDGETLQEWYEHAVSRLRSKPRPNFMTVEQYRQADPEMPLEVAQWMTDRHNRSASEHTYLDLEFGPQADPEHLAALSPVELFGRMLEERDARTQIQRQVAQPQLAKLAGETPLYRYEVIGEVRAGALAYVIYSAGGPPQRTGTASVLVLKPTKEGWRISLNSDLLYLGSGLNVFVSDEAFQQKPLAVSQIPWLDRRFDHQMTPDYFPVVLERFRGAAPRIDQLAMLVPSSLRTKRIGNQWSIQEHIGHLLDLEELGEQRLSEFERRAETLTAADMTNQKTEQAHHNGIDWWLLFHRFCDARGRLVGRLEALPADIIAHKALHPRLQRMMNVPEWIFFMCEHDDHHLARIRELSIRLTS